MDSPLFKTAEGWLKARYFAAIWLCRLSFMLCEVEADEGSKGEENADKCISLGAQGASCDEVQRNESMCCGWILQICVRDKSHAHSIECRPCCYF
jgi:hypothetical protein